MGYIRIGMDIRNLNYRSGFSRAFYVFLQGLDQDRARITLFTDMDKLPDLPNRNLIDKVIKKPAKIPWRLWTNSFALNRYLEGVDVFLGICNTIPLFVRTKKILYLWDIYGWLAIKKRYFEFIKETKPNELFTFLVLIPLSIFRADLILTPSEFTKKSIIETFRVSDRKIIVVPAAIDQTFERVSADEVKKVKMKYGIRKPYTISVGNYRYHRNYGRIIDAFRELKKEIDVQLVVCGNIGGREKLFREVEDVIVTGSISDEELKALYSGAVFLTHVTLMEGFGMTPLEAMRCGCPVLCSDSCSLPEICSDAAYYVNPESTEEIKEGMKLLFGNRKLREELIERGYRNVQRYSPRRFAEEIIDIVKNM